MAGWLALLLETTRAAHDKVHRSVWVSAGDDAPGIFFLCTLLLCVTDSVSTGHHTPG